MKKIILILFGILISINIHSQTKVTEIEYWLDNDYSNKLTQAISSSSAEALIVSSLDLPQADNGFHKLSLRVKDNNNKWSVVYDYNFFKAGSSNSDDILITKYRYWFDVDRENIIEVDLPNPIEIFLLDGLINIEVDNPENVPQSFSIQFLDNTGIWSHVYTKLFIPEPSFEVYNLMNTFNFKNTSSFAKYFTWDFGDGSTIDSTINPTHTYNSPGVYTVTLTAKNSLGVADTFDIVTVRGLREVVANQAGNTGDASILVYGGGFSKSAKVWLEGPETIYADTSMIQRLDAIYAKFNLRDKKIGVYDVLVQFEGEDAMKLEKSFTIIQGTAPEPFVNIVGRERILFGRWQTYQLNIGNTGNTDATGVTMFLVVSKDGNTEIDLSNINISLTQEAIDAGWGYILDSVQIRESIWELFGEPFDGWIYAFYIPVISANSNESVNIRFKSNKDLKLYTWLNDPYYQSPFNSDMALCISEAIGWWALNKGYDLGTNMIPGYDCIKGAGKLAVSTTYNTVKGDIDPLGKKYKNWKERIWGWGSWVADITVLAADCALDFYPGTYIASKVKKLGEVAWTAIKDLNSIQGDMNKFYMADVECREKFANKSKKNLNVKAVSSFDPNEIVGPAGFTSNVYTRNEGAFNYKIYFENKATASAPAQEVIVLDTLDKSKYDFSTFSFGPFGYGDNIYFPLNGLKEYTLEIDSLKTEGVILRVSAKFDTATGIASWQYITLDTNTMDYPEDPDAGFLPPNKTSPEGEGFVSFNIITFKTLADNEEISNKAKIVFDLNEPIWTNTYTNHLDLTPPVSKLTEIQSTWETDLYRFFIDATDSLSGIRNYTLFASKNDSAYKPVLITNQNPFYYKCEPGLVYNFFSIAQDSVSNTEPIKSESEVSTLNVSVKEYFNPIEISSINVFPNPANDRIFVDIFSNGDGLITFGIYNQLGIDVRDSLNETIYHGFNRKQIDISNIPSGVYYFVIKTSNRSIYKSIIVNH
ncbi:MAG: PKD domain-containing protein [bacterium]